MATGLLFDSRFLLHDTGPLHPERPARLESIRAGLQESGLYAALTPIAPRKAELAFVEAVHDGAYLRRIQAACQARKPIIDVPDSAIGPQSWEIALLASGGVLAMCDAVMQGGVTNGFCTVRPPGHHAEYDHSLGFCLLNNVAIAAKYLQLKHGIKKVAIVDFDVHHGNGTQHLLESDPSVLFISLHEHPNYLYPGTGYEWERGKGDGEGYTLNIPFLPEATDAHYQWAFDQQVLPKLQEFKPEVLLISAGFDAHRDDPLSHIRLTEEGFGFMTRALVQFAKTHCQSRLISTLEGGYNLHSLALSVVAHARELIGQ